MRSQIVHRQFHVAWMGDGGIGGGNGTFGDLEALHVDPETWDDFVQNCEQILETGEVQWKAVLDKVAKSKKEKEKKKASNAYESIE